MPFIFFIYFVFPALAASITAQALEPWLLETGDTAHLSQDGEMWGLEMTAGNGVVVQQGTANQGNVQTVPQDKHL